MNITIRKDLGLKQLEALGTSAVGWSSRDERQVDPGLTGRDVKNLFKLSVLVAKDGRITAKTVAFVRQFKPTETAGA